MSVNGALQIILMMMITMTTAVMLSAMSIYKILPVTLSHPYDILSGILNMAKE